jgi:hypothetical protein
MKRIRDCATTTRLADVPGGMPSSLEIAQSAVLRPIDEVAAEAGLEPGEVELYGRHKAKINLSVLERLADRPRSTSTPRTRRRSTSASSTA